MRRRKRGFGLSVLLIAVLATAIYLAARMGYLEDLIPKEKKVYEGLSWNLTLVNDEWAVPEDWEIELTELRDDQRVDSRMYPDLQDMFDACRADGLYPLVWSSYREEKDQQRLMDEKVEGYLAAGLSQHDAEREAKLWVAEVGYSEHQLGLAVDINSEDESLCSSWDVYAWLAEHCDEYGFILRYPEDKTDITGIDYEPWHFRYVGKDAAKEIMESGLCLEEYIEKYYPQ